LPPVPAERATPERTRHPALPDDEWDVAVVGAGLVGLAAAMALLEARPALRLAVVEKERSLAFHQSGHNSGVLHAGLYYQPGSLKARFCKEGRDALVSFADEHGIPYRICGKIVVAAGEDELSRLDDLGERGRANGLTIRELGPSEWSELEPSVHGVRALHVAESGVVDYAAVAAAYAGEIRGKGGEILLGRRVERIERVGRSCRLATDAGELACSGLVVCAGLQADRLAELARGPNPDVRVVPFRGDYYTFLPHAQGLVNGLVYPVPDPAFPFLGVHFTRKIGGELLAGPNALPSLAREGYGRLSVDLRDAADTLRFPGLRRFARAYARTGALELWRDLVKPAAVARMQRYLPMLRPGDLVFGPSGIRAQMMRRDGTLVDDFLVEESERMIHVLNAPSPAATASIIIGRNIAGRAIERFEL
jgi:(S)-2-hydroxyglutarate dehydrogenase